MFKNISPETQLILVIIGLAVLFVIVMLNHKRNQSKRLSRKGKQFGQTRSNKRKK